MTGLFTYFTIVFCIVTSTTSAQTDNEKDYKIKIFTVASEENDGYKRYIRSANFYKINVETLGLGEEWLGGDMSYPGGGYKVNVLKKAIEPYKDDKEQLILFTDSYDVLFLSSISTVIEKFRKTSARILFGAEQYCWPDQSLEHIYPMVEKNNPKFLNSGLFIGYANDLYSLLSAPIRNLDDDQLYFSRLYLDEKVREKHKMKLDHKTDIFLNLNGASAAFKLENDTTTGEWVIKNLATEQSPCIVHGNGPSKILLNNYDGYLVGGQVKGKCEVCKEGLLKLDPKKLPIVLIGIFIEKAMPFMDEFFDNILTLDYPKKKLHLFIHNNVPYHSDIVNEFIEKYGSEYLSLKKIVPDDNISEAIARNLAIDRSKQKSTDYFFVVDAEARIDNPSTLKQLIKQNRNVIAPKMSRHNEAWSNFWGALSAEGYYARSHDYLDIVYDKVRGLWNAPFISSCYLINKSVFNKISYQDDTLDADMAMCKYLRSTVTYMYVQNLESYGHLVNGDQFNPVLKHPDFYMLIDNEPEWIRRYIHPEYAGQLVPNVTHKQPCPDVYWFPIVTERFCHELIDIVEHFGKWSDGTNNDERLQGGYEAVPTRDIHMNQVGLDPLWLHFLYTFVRPLQESVFLQYYHSPPNSLMNFVVRYKPEEQPYLRPHHDSSTYTINIALNRAGIDYEGGGCHFLRYNCSVRDTQMGWMLMHPGRLTHLHEGMRTTKGTRYIMISFVDP